LDSQRERYQGRHCVEIFPLGQRLTTKQKTQRSAPASSDAMNVEPNAMDRAGLILSDVARRLRNSEVPLLIARSSCSPVLPFSHGRVWNRYGRFWAWFSRTARHGSIPGASTKIV